MYDKSAKCELVKVYRESVRKDKCEQDAYILKALEDDLADGGLRYEDILIATFGHY